ncbi:MAG: hypothetical protein KDB27_33560 [Planctomycetales bacterium]|nr:hypothetical protein [Planctomycetales bacterium]
MYKKRFSIDNLEERIAPAGCQFFGDVVSAVAHGNAADYGLEIPDGPANQNGSDVGNLKSAIGTDDDPGTKGVSDRIHASHGYCDPDA